MRLCHTVTSVELICKKLPLKAPRSSDTAERDPEQIMCTKSGNPRITGFPWPRCSSCSSFTGPAATPTVLSAETAMNFNMTLIKLSGNLAPNSFETLDLSDIMIFSGLAKLQDWMHYTLVFLHWHNLAVPSVTVLNHLFQEFPVLQTRNITFTL